MPENTDSNSVDFLKSIRDVAFVIAVYLYFAGWVYIYTYFNFFGLSVGQVDIEFYSFLIYSVNVMTYLLISHWFISLCFVFASIGAVHRFRYSWVPYVVSVVLFAVIYYSAILAGRRDARNDFAYQGSSLTKIKFVLKDNDTAKPKTINPPLPVIPATTIPAIANKPATVVKPLVGSFQKPLPPPTIHFIIENLTDDFITYNQQDKLRLMLDNKDEYVVLVADNSATYDNAFAKYKQIYIVKKDKIELAKITR